MLVVAFLHLGYHRAQFSAPERERLYQTYLQHPVAATLADPTAALRLHHVRDGDEYLYLAWADLMLGEPADRDFLAGESDATIPLLPSHAPSPHERLLPYRDFVFQYPPLALLPILVPALITIDPVLYPYAFGILAGFAALVIAAAGLTLHEASGLSKRGYLWLSALALFLVGVTLETRLDVFAAAFVAVALWAASTRRWILACALLGAGAALKIYPGLLLPAFVLPLASQRQHRQLLLALAAFAATVAAACAVPAMVSWSGFLHALQLQSARGLQVESIGATAIAWVQVVAGAPLETVRAFGARDLVSPWSQAVATAGRVAVVICAVLLPWWMAKVEPSRPLVDTVALAIAGLWISSPVLSPQYLVWGLPVFLLATSRTARWLFLFALGVTRIEYPACYPFIAHLTLPGLSLLTLRNGLLLATWIALLRHWFMQRRAGRPTSAGSGRRERPLLHRG